MVLWITELFESGGREVAKRLARRMDVPLYDLDMQPETQVPEGLQDGVVLDSCALWHEPGEEAAMILLHSSMACRSGRLSRSQDITPEAAEREVLRRDRERAMLFGAGTGRPWPDYSGSDLAVDVGKLGLQATEELLIQYVAMKTMRRRRKEGSGWAEVL